MEYGVRRQFNVDWLKNYNWLRYSVSEDSVYCAPCFLFGSRNVDAREKTLVSTAVTKWSNLGKYIKRHIISKCHDGACNSADQFMRIHNGKEPSVLSQLDSGHAALVKRNRHSLQAIIEVIMLCGRQNISLRSHDDENSNFMVLLKDRAVRDPILKAHLESISSPKYTSPAIQNEIIGLCEQAIREHIVEKCNNAVCYSFLADEATDASTMEQIAMVVRFYSESDKMVREDFIGFVTAESTTGEALATKFIDGQRNAGLNIHKMRGQGYDGASNMSGRHRGVQARIKEVVPEAIYIHCKAHSLNLAIVHACREVLVRNMFDTVQQIGFSFNYSAKRLLTFQETLQNDAVAKEEMEKRTKLQNLCETRWASRADALYTFKSAFSTIVDSLEVLEHEGDSKARSYRCSILKFDFIISLVAVEFVIQSILPLNKLLQGKECDLVEASKEASVLIAQLRAERMDDDVWDALYQKAIDLASPHDVRPSRPRIGGRQEHRPNQPAETVSEYWKRALYIPFMDHLTMELQDRLLSANYRFLAQYLIPSLLGQLTAGHVDEIYEGYKTDLSGDRELFRREISRWRTKWSVADDPKPVDLLTTILATNRELYPDIFTCLVILLTMPVSTASAERSFSVMRRVKTYLRSTMSTTRLSGLAMLHSYRHMQLDIEDILDKFAGKKGRTMDFF
ncbi:zinc finger MYM-type protein 1-like [Pecten maximus]|uniref:zinc finger MYM-type protein 1-like n=1 Tax=Pecten maximus TaxID=6579 RepID=UPI00145908A8|nr:zinc finger MYM-type protein 1-like [Pecten maximus]